ncbi:Hypothetical_protein [Hexamita inflata]|uniref:Hypothetical_protein n=1 Tax=Hexamita inflata TaxID=28002 RepID=A0ABP1GUT7_9EUKA
MFDHLLQQKQVQLHAVHLNSKHEATDFDKEYLNYIQSATFSSVSAITPIQNSDSVMLTVTPTQPVKRMLHSEEELLKIEEILRFFAVCDLSFEKVKIPFVQHFLDKIRGPDQRNTVILLNQYYQC